MASNLPMPSLGKLAIVGPVVKKRPGRPCKTPVAQQIPFHGISPTPNNPENKLELVSSSPSNFKVMFNYFKIRSVKELHLRCDHVGLTFFAKNHDNTSKIIGYVYGQYMNWYYCAEEFWVDIDTKNIEGIFSAIDKTCHKITIVQAIDDPQKLTFVLRNSILEKDNTYVVDLNIFPKDEELIATEECLTPEGMSKYKICFTLPSKDFKKSICDISDYSETFSIEKIQDRPLCLTWMKHNVQGVESYKCDEKIKFRSTLDPEDIFKITVKTSNIKAMTTSSFTNDVNICCRADGDILLRLNIDEKSIILHTFTKIE